MIMRNLYSVLMTVADSKMEKFETEHNIYCFR